MDGCRGGWVIASADGLRVVPSFAEIVAEGFELALIDVPIGLLESGPRACDVEARKLLGPRRSSVFPAPPRRLLSAAKYAGQCSIQLWNILAKIREVDSALTPRLQTRIREAHPECSFRLLHGGPLPHPKKAAQGLALRRRLLRPHFGRLDAIPGAALDDVLDAYALLWSAGRLAAGRGLVLGGERDSRGLRCEICA